MKLSGFYKLFVILALVTSALCRSRGLGCKAKAMRSSNHTKCSMHFECTIAGVKVDRKCPNGQYFNETLQLCKPTHSGCPELHFTPSEITTTQAAPPVCNLLSEMMNMWPNFGIVSLDCTSWLRCSSGGPVVNGCPKGMTLGHKNLCEFPPNVNCVEGAEFKYIHPIFDEGRSLKTERGMRRFKHSRGRKRVQSGRRKGGKKKTSHSEAKPSVTPHKRKVTTG